MARTNTTLVQAVLGSDYGRFPQSMGGGQPDLQQYIDTATLTVDQVEVKAAAKNKALTTAQLEMIERWLAAHYYTRMDPTYTSRSTQGASGNFTQPKDDPERYRKTAIELDTSGSLNAILNRLTAGTEWLGKPKSAQIPYDERD
jgi:hypothetical protein